MKQESRNAVNQFITSAKKEFLAFADSASAHTYEDAVELICTAQKSGNRLHVTGIGKPAHIGKYIASLLSSTGNPCYFLDGTEAVHGSCGQLSKGDIVLCISNSGETQELKATVNAIRNNGCRLVAVTGNPASWLGKHCDLCLSAGVTEEGGPLNRAPRNSITVEALTLQALSVALQAEKNWSPQEYVRCHPGGTLGKLREHEVS